MKYITSALTLLILCQSLFAEEKVEQLKLPDFPEGTAPSEKAKKYLTKHGDFDKGILVERNEDKSGKVYLSKGKYHKLPDNKVTWDHLEHMDGFVIAFNEFIPLPEWKSNSEIRYVSFSTNEKRQENHFMFGKDLKNENCTIAIKENTQNTRYLMKSFAYKFKRGSGAPVRGFSSFTYWGTDDNPIDTINSYWKLGTTNNADYARDMTRRNYMDTTASRPLFAYFASKGKTAEEAMKEAEVKMEKAEKEFLKRVNEK